jgi:hypothetical protein
MESIWIVGMIVARRLFIRPTANQLIGPQATAYLDEEDSSTWEESTTIEQLCFQTYL